MRSLLWKLALGASAIAVSVSQAAAVCERKTDIPAGYYTYDWPRDGQPRRTYSAEKTEFHQGKPFQFPVYKTETAPNVGGSVDGRRYDNVIVRLYSPLIWGTIRVHPGFNATDEFIHRPPNSTSPVQYSAGVWQFKSFHSYQIRTYMEEIGCYGLGCTAKIWKNHTPLAGGSMDEHWERNYNPDIRNIPDSTVLEHATANGELLTEDSRAQTKKLLDASAGTIPQQHLQLKSGGWPRYPRGEPGGSSCLDEDLQFTWVQAREFIKHPRLADVWMIKTFMPYTGMMSLWTIAVGAGSDHDGFYYVPILMSANQAPELRDDAASTNYRTPVTFNVLANDVDPDGAPEPLKVTSVQTPAHGSLTWLPDGTVTYTPAGEWMGEVVLDYTATDGAAEATAKIRITVNDAGLEPVAGNDIFVTTWDKPITLQPLSNDVIPDMRAISITAIGAPARGSAIINSDRQSIRYIPVSGLTGSFTFPYTISDTKKASSATITVVVREPDQGRSDWDAKPFNYEDWCRNTIDGKARQGRYSDDCWKMMRDAKPVPN